MRWPPSTAGIQGKGKGGGQARALGVVALRRRCTKCPQWACFGPRASVPLANRARATESVEGQGTELAVRIDQGSGPAVGTVGSGALLPIGSKDVSGEGSSGGGIEVPRGCGSEWGGGAQEAEGAGVGGCGGGGRWSGRGRRGWGRGPRLMVRHCKVHAEAGEVDLIHLIRCKHAGCETIPSFGFEGGQPLFCKRHRLLQHKGLIGYRCAFAEGCSLRAAYGDASAGSPRFCARHRRSLYLCVCVCVCVCICVCICLYLCLCDQISPVC